jgi:pimeloyl-ACP methyl ester carboxylesterase
MSNEQTGENRDAKLAGISGRNIHEYDDSGCHRIKFAVGKSEMPERGKRGIVVRAIVIKVVCTAGVLWTELVGAGDPDRTRETPNEADAPQSPGSSKEKPGPQRDITMKTLGGRQFWGDLQFFHQWRIQRNVLTGQCRLLDGDDYRHASGTLEECQKKLDEIKEANKLPPMKGRAVILVHGIFRSSKSMAKVRKALQGDDCEVFGFDYPSTRVTIADSAEYLHESLQSLEGIDDIQFVVHSMGGLVVRAYLAKHRDPRISRMVMIGVPNLGAEMADLLKQNFLFKTLYGPAGQQLGSDPEGFIAGLPTPDFEFGVLAGARGTLNGYNVLIAGDDDGTVSVACTRLPGATDFVSIPCLHSFLVGNAEAVGYTKHFLKHGCFRKEGEVHAIPKEARTAVNEPQTAKPAK